jgi:hypothetical protein
MQAALRLLKHCEDSLPAPSVGALLGLDDQDGVLHVSYAFALPRREAGSGDMGGHMGRMDGGMLEDETEEDRAEKLEKQSFKTETMRMLKEVSGSVRTGEAREGEGAHSTQAS